MKSGSCDWMKYNGNSVSIKINNFYEKVNKKIGKFRWFLAIYAVAVIIMGICLHYVYAPTLAPEYQDDVPMFLYYTWLSILFVSSYYALWITAKVIKSDFLLKLTENNIIKLFMVFNIFVTGWVYVTMIFWYSIRDAMAIGQTWYYCYALIPTILEHIILPTLVWLEFRGSKYSSDVKVKKYDYLYNIIFPLVYYYACFIYGTHTGIFPYPFLDYINDPKLVAIAVPLMTVAFFFVAMLMQNRYKVNQIKVESAVHA